VRLFRLPRQDGGDDKRHGVPGHREAEASQDGVRLLRLWRGGRVDSQGEQGGLLSDSVSLLSALHLSKLLTAIRVCYVNLEISGPDCP
jgi:hypothetical protein